MAVAAAPEDEGPGIQFSCGSLWHGMVQVPSLEVTAGYLKGRIADLSGKGNGTDLRRTGRTTPLCILSHRAGPIVNACCCLQEYVRWKR
jgi:hypothetical protein